MTDNAEYHFIGIGGIGMSALAHYLLSRSHKVSGSDKVHTPLVQQLQDRGAYLQPFMERQKNENVVVIYSSAISKEHPERLEAARRCIQEMHRAELLQKIAEPYRLLAITGTHGKSTTSALLTWVMHYAKKMPSYVLGALTRDLPYHGHSDRGEELIAEADESDGSFLNYEPYGAILTNIDSDHLDHYSSMQALIDTYALFTYKVKNPSLLFWNGDCPHLLPLQLPGVSYGFGSHCHLRANNIRASAQGMYFDLKWEKEHHADIFLPLYGNHQIANALSTFGMAYRLGVEPEVIISAWRKFSGIARRCEKIFDKNGLTVIDDYAHHPSAIAATLRALKQAHGDRRLVVAYQPHRYSRLKYSLEGYQECFSVADKVIVTDIYSAGESSNGLSHVDVQRVIKSADLDVEYAPREDLACHIEQQLAPLDLLVSMGAGDIHHLFSEMQSLSTAKPLAQITVALVFGGRSCEHAISKLSARYIYSLLSQGGYQVEPFAITIHGTWIGGARALEILEAKGIAEDKASVVMSDEVLKALQGCDVAFPILHGPYGEDGTFQGFCEMLGIPYVGCSHFAAAVSMDKTMTKQLLLAEGISTSPFVPFCKEQWQMHSLSLIAKIQNTLRLPVFVKPVHLGSSLGTSKVLHWQELPQAIAYALKSDYEILVEQAIVGREIEFALLGSYYAQVFKPGEILTEGQFYHFDAKYGSEAIPTTTHPYLDHQTLQNGWDIAQKAYRAVKGSGMARVDCFLDINNHWWVSEINPIPGFTPMSLYPKMCIEGGLEGIELMHRLIAGALALKRRRDSLTPSVYPLPV